MQLATKGQFWKVYLNHYGYIITTGTLEFFYLECVFQMEISSKPPFVRLHLYKLQQILFQLTTTNYSKICSLGMFKIRQSALKYYKNIWYLVWFPVVSIYYKAVFAVSHKLVKEKIFGCVFNITLADVIWVL